MRTCVVLFALFLIPAARAASFDCAKAEKPIEKAICSDSKLSAADSSMAALYRNDLTQLSSTSIGLLRADQVQWLAWVQQLCHATDGIMTSPEMAVCLQPLYTDRIKTLRKSVLRRDGLSFLTRTQYLAMPEAAKSSGKPEHPGFGTLQASWPVADSTDEGWIAWNRTLEQRLIRMAGGTKGTWTDDESAEEDATVEAHLKYVEHDRVTTGLSMAAMGHGAAHPNEEWSTLTYLLDTHRALRADDVFAASVDWKSAMAAICWMQLSTGEHNKRLYEQITGPGAKEIQQVVVDTGTWTLEHDGIHISYPEYSVSPRAAPMDDSIILWSDLRPLLAPDFVLP